MFFFPFFFPSFFKNSQKNLNHLIVNFLIGLTGERLTCTVARAGMNSQTTPLCGTTELHAPLGGIIIIIGRIRISITGLIRSHYVFSKLGNLIFIVVFFSGENTQ